MEDFRGRFVASDGEENGPVTRLEDDGADFSRGSDESSTKPTAKSCQAPAKRAAQYFRITGDLGPVWVLARRGSPPPAVVVERSAARTRVWIEHSPWAWNNGLREFLNPDSPSVEHYAKRLAVALRDEALKEHGRRVRNRELRDRERAAIIASRNGGGK